MGSDKTSNPYLPTTVNEKSADAVVMIKPTGTTNDSPNINSILSVGNQKFLIKKGDYNINEDILIKSNSVIEWEEGARFRKSPTSFERYNMLYLEDVRNITLINPQIIGDKYSHLGTTGEWGNGIVLRGTNNVKIRNAVIKECWGDGILVGAVYNSDVNTYKRYCENTWINDTICDDNRRNGLTVGSAKGLFVRDSQFNNTKGTDPQAGIDIEPDSVYTLTEDIHFDNILLKNNAGRGIFFCLWLSYGDRDDSPSKNISITCKNIKVTGGGYGFETVLSNFTDGNNTHVYRNAIKNLSGEIKLIDCETINTSLNGVRLYRWFDAGLKITFDNLKIENPNQEKGTSIGHNAIVLYDYNGSTTPAGYPLGNVEFNNLVVKHSIDDPLKRSIYVTDPKNNNPVRNFILRNSKIIEGSVRLEQMLDSTCKVIDENEVHKLIDPITRPVEKGRDFYTIISNMGATSSVTKTVKALGFHNEKVTFLTETNHPYVIKCSLGESFFPFGNNTCTLMGIGSKLTIKRINDTSWQVAEVLGGTWSTT